MGFDLSLFLKDQFRPGVNWIVEGPRGSGKTYAVIALLHGLVNGRFPGCGRVEVITNIVFGTKNDAGHIVMGHPPGVAYVNTMADALRKTGEILRKYGMGKVTIAFVLDESQNFMIADLNAAAENQALIKFMGNTRKFGMCTMFLTPTRRNLAPKIRNFDDDVSAPGYCGVLMRKDVTMASTASKMSRGRIPARELSFLSLSSEMENIPVQICATDWTMPLESLKAGEYSYDTLSAADFSLGENSAGKTFDIKDFLKEVSKGISTAIPDAIGEYFDKWDVKEDEESGPDLTGAKADRVKQACRVERARLSGVKWSTIAFIEGESEQLLQYHHKKEFGEQKKSQQIDTPGRAHIKPNGGDGTGSFDLPAESIGGECEC
ncbi:MAG: hypothetical protein PHI87_06190 [Candidatus Methanomethylophilus sp.]|nr:hypothetical protein [Methanomethylophilus sp.]MDD4222504.1 hypothetical protein [Methanomethylophilus sp.]